MGIPTRASFLLLLAGACATTSPSPVAVGPSAVSPPAPSVQAVGLKRKVAVLRFSNETKYGRGVFGSREPAIEKQAEDILKARLVDSGVVLLVESDLAAQADIPEVASIGADFAILGSVSEFGRQVTSETGVFSRTKKQVAYAAVNLRLIDTRTGVVVYAEEGRGEADIEAGRVLGVGTDAGYDTSINDKAISAAIGSLITNVLQNLADQPWKTSILALEAGQVMIAGGSEQGLRVGDILAIRKRGRQVENRQLGGMIELPGVDMGKIRVLSFFGVGLQEGAVCEWIEGAAAGATLEELVVEEVQS
jgi:curli biogenesis system outer membrane secretion channel CsgG